MELFISIHAPTRGATVEGQRYLERNVEFQSTLPREERLGKVCCDIKRIKISIHAPTRGATINIGNKIHWIIYFNPRSHERSDVKSKSKKGWCIIFQSTLPREERRQQDILSLVSLYFNPRSHERSDDLTQATLSEWAIFQSTLPREERLCPDMSKEDDTIISIHAPTRGATLVQNWYINQK